MRASIFSSNRIDEQSAVTGMDPKPSSMRAHRASPYSFARACVNTRGTLRSDGRCCLVAEIVTYRIGIPTTAQARFHTQASPFGRDAHHMRLKEREVVKPYTHRHRRHQRSKTVRTERRVITEGKQRERRTCGDPGRPPRAGFGGGRAAGKSPYIKRSFLRVVST